jgi:uncharacterized membrane protein YhhN
MLSMNKKVWIVIYLLVLAVDLFAIYYSNEAIRYISKPLLMLLLAAYFISNTEIFVSVLKKWIIPALLFSWAGDVLLMFESFDAFLIAHVFYILFFENIFRNENLKKNYWLFIPVLVYYVWFVYLLSPHLGEMKLPVRVYGVVISYMLIQALQVVKIKNTKAALLMISGAVLFIISDSILAINKFYTRFELAGIAIMTTYGIAQLLITLGAVRYITSTSKQ